MAGGHCSVHQTLAPRIDEKGGIRTEARNRWGGTRGIQVRASGGWAATVNDGEWGGQVLHRPNNFTEHSAFYPFKMHKPVIF